MQTVVTIHRLNEMLERSPDSPFLRHLQLLLQSPRHRGQHPLGRNAAVSDLQHKTLGLMRAHVSIQLTVAFR